jgi:sugar lactone lactonase YvrE
MTDYMDVFAANRRKVFNLAENGVAGNPDGMTIDSEGNLWIAAFGGSQVCIILQLDYLYVKLISTELCPYNAYRYLSFTLPL